MLDTNNTDRPYLLGRATALIQSVTDMPQRAVNTIAQHPIDMVKVWLVKATLNEQDDLMEVMGKIDEIPTSLTPVEQGRFWMGYYHQMSGCSLRQSVGRQIHNARTAKNLSCKQLAGLSGISESTVCKIENGRWSVSLDLLERVTVALGLILTLAPQQEKEA